MNDSVKRNIAVLINNMGRGGAQRVISRIVPEFEKRYNVCLILLDSSKNVYHSECKIVSLGVGEEKNRVKYISNLFSQGKRLARYIEEHNIQCVISFLTVPNILNLAYNKHARKIMSIRLAAKYDLNEGLVSRIKHYIERSLSVKADAAIVPSIELKEEFVEEYRVSEEKTYVVYNPFDVSLIQEKCKHTDKSSDHTIVAMGRLDKQKGFVHLIRSMKYVVERVPDARLIILGEGSERSNIERCIEETHMSDHVILHGDTDEPFPIISDSRLFVMSSIAEGFPNALVEAMACGVPVISTDCKTGPKEILRDRYSGASVVDNYELAEYGILVPVFTDDSSDNMNRYKILADAISTVIVDDELLDKYSKMSYDRASEYSLEKSAQGFIDVIEKVIVD